MGDFNNNKVISEDSVRGDLGINILTLEKNNDILVGIIKHPSCLGLVHLDKQCSASTALNKLVLRFGICRRVLRFLNTTVVGLMFGWVVRFSVVGYHYIIKGSNRFGFLQFRVGLRYRILVMLPSSIKIFLEKRKFTLVSTDLKELLVVCKYIKNLRNLLPYKNKGISFEIVLAILKQGKKARLH